jgi:hypothetical protein
VRGGVGPNCSERTGGDCDPTVSRRDNDGTGGARLFLSSKLDLPFTFDNERALFSLSLVFSGAGGGGTERLTSPERLSIVVEVRGVVFVEWFLDGTLEEPLEEPL